jgi:hypothetical protein
MILKLGLCDVSQSEGFNVQFTSQSTNGKSTVHDLLGRKLFEKSMKTRVNSTKNPIEKHPSRTLFVDCYRWGKERSQKISD